MGTPFPFQFVPANLRLPGFVAEVSAVNANTNQQAQVALLIGQITSAGTATPNQPVICAGAADAIAKCGQGSILAIMAAAFAARFPLGEFWLLPVQDGAGATAATGSLTFTAANVAAGALSIYIAACAQGVVGLPTRVQVGVTAAMTAAQVATAVVAAINAAPNMPVSAAVDGTTTSKVDLTALNKGLCGNDIDIRLNYLGTAGGEATPAGLTVAITAMSGGTINPTLTTALANLSTHPFDFIGHPFTDTASIQALTGLLSDSSGRWSYANQLYGHAFGAYRGTYGSATTFGVGLNDPHQSFMAIYDTPSPNWVWAADITAAAAQSLTANPALPFGGEVVLSEVLAPQIGSRFEPTERNTLLFDGLSTFKVQQSGAVMIEELVTTYQVNPQGEPDDSYLYVNTMFQLMAYLRARASLVASWGRMNLVADGTRVPPGSSYISPSLARAALIAQYQTLCPQLVQAPAAYAAGLNVAINGTNTSRLDIQDDPILTGGLRIVALLAQFQLAPPATSAA